MKFQNKGAVTRFWYKLLPYVLVNHAIKINLLYLLSLPFSWLHLLALSHFGSVGTIGPCSPSWVCVCFGWWCVALFYVPILGSHCHNKKKKFCQKKSPARKKNTVAIPVNNSPHLKKTSGAAGLSRTHSVLSKCMPHRKGWAEYFFPTLMTKPPGGPEGPTHPP